MIIAAAQSSSITGDVGANVERHMLFVESAVEKGAEMVVFPELSLTGYEPALAGKLATTADDSRLDSLQALANTKNVTIGAGLPLKNSPRPTISMVIIRPNRARQVYSKQFIHADEEPFFVNGRNGPLSLPSPPKIALAICYEISVAEHAETAYRHRADVYIASVAKFRRGIDKARKRLAEIARRYSMVVMMANCVGLADGQPCAGGTAVWNSEGQLLGQLNDTNEGIMIFDTVTISVQTFVFLNSKDLGWRIPKKQNSLEGLNDYQ